MESISFEDLGLDQSTLAAVAAKGFVTPSPIQVLAIPRLLSGETNLIAKARTGTGKTAAFGLPLVQQITEDKGYPQALVLTPTRELALQVCKEVESFTTGRFPRCTPVYGGQSMGEQLRALRRGAEIVVGTPGRVKDHLERGSLKLDNISYFVLDEADEMLDMGFIDDIECIFSQANPNSRILLFSATMPSAILKIAAKFMGDYEIVEEEERPEEPLLTEQRYWMVRENEKIEALVRMIDISPDFYGLVFTQTKNDADMVAKQLDERGYEAAAMHGDVPQAQREKILSRFRRKKTRILVATDVAARGIDIEGLTHVVNYALPFDAPTYVHRIGRTGRAGAKGLAFTMVRPEERRKLDFLKQAARKATKGEMKEDTIPTVEQVLLVKRERLFAEMKESLGFGSQSEEVVPMDDEVVESSEDKVVVDESFTAMAEELCESRDSKEVLAAVLALSYGRALDASRYGEITSFKTFNQGNQVRVYVGLGRRDGFNPREIAEYFSGLLNIPQRMVDRIDVADSFSLVSLPSQAGLDAIERSKRDSTMPHMHVDSKEQSFGGGSRGGYGGGRGGRGHSRSDENRSSRSGRDSGGNRRSGRPDRFGNEKRSGGGRGTGGDRYAGKSEARSFGPKPVHSSENRTHNAGLYKKGNRKASGAVEY